MTIALFDIIGMACTLACVLYTMYSAIAHIIKQNDSKGNLDAMRACVKRELMKENRMLMEENRRLVGMLEAEKRPHPSPSGTPSVSCADSSLKEVASE